MRKVGPVRASRFLAYILRHNPDDIRVIMSLGGWVNIRALIAATKDHKVSFTEDLIKKILETDVKRYAVSADGSMIRAKYGHSVPINLPYEGSTPPDVLYHGTSVDALKSIMDTEGLTPQTRRCVHLSEDYHTADTTGARHGSSVVLKVFAKLMNETRGTEFLNCGEGTWLVSEVPVEFIGFA